MKEEKEQSNLLLDAAHLFRVARVRSQYPEHDVAQAGTSATRSVDEKLHRVLCVAHLEARQTDAAPLALAHTTNPCSYRCLHLDFLCAAGARRRKRAPVARPPRTRQVHHLTRPVVHDAHLERTLRAKAVQRAEIVVYAASHASPILSYLSTSLNIWLLFSQLSWHYLI